MWVVGRVAWLSSVVLDWAMALGMVLLAIHWFGRLRGEGRADVLWPVLGTMRLAPWFFEPLRTFSAAYQDRIHATGAAESLIDLPPLPEPVPSRKSRTVAAQGVTVAFDNPARRSFVVEMVPLEDMRNGGSLEFQPVPGTEFQLAADLVLLAMGFVGPERGPLLEQLGVALTARGNVARDDRWLTNVDGVFVCGDMGRGQSLIVWAIAEGRSCAAGVDNGLMGETLLPAPIAPTTRQLL